MRKHLLNTASIHYPFGMSMESYSDIEYNYSYGMNTQEKDDEIYGEGNSYSAEYWQYDARLGRRWNVDPRDVPSFSPYSCFANNPIWFSDVYGDSAVGSSAPTQAEVQRGDGPYQFAKRNNITPEQLIEWNKDVFPEGFTKGTWIIHPGQKLNTSDPNQPSSTIENTGGSSGTSLASDFIGSTAYRPNMYFAGSIFNRPPTSVSGSNNSGSSLSGVGMGLGGLAMSGTQDLLQGSTFRLYRMQGSQFSPKLHTSGWGGGSVGQIKTYSATPMASTLKWGGRGLGAYNMGLNLNDYANQRLSTFQFVGEFGTSTYSTFGGIYGAAWGFGWELGRVVTQTEPYLDFKYWLYKDLFNMNVQRSQMCTSCPK